MTGSHGFDDIPEIKFPDGHPGQKYVVEVLMKIHELAKAKFSYLKGLAKHPAAISRALKKLRGERLIERRVLDDEDRSVEYSLTSKGNTIIQYVNEILKSDE